MSRCHCYVAPETGHFCLRSHVQHLGKTTWSPEGNSAPRLFFWADSGGRRWLTGQPAPRAPAHLLLVLLLHPDQLCLQLRLHLSAAIPFLKQHLLHFGTTGLVLFQDALELADLDFGGDQLEGIKDDELIWRMVTFPCSLGRKMSPFLKWTEEKFLHVQVRSYFFMSYVMCTIDQ